MQFMNDEAKTETEATKPSSRPLGRHFTGYSRWRNYLEVTYFAAVIVGVPLVVLQMFVAAENRKVDHTLAYVARFNDETMSEVRMELSRSWIQSGVNFREVSARGGLSPAQAEKLVRMVIANSAAGRNELELNILAMTKFFDEVAICVKHNRCKEDVINESFSEYAKRFGCLYRPIIEDFRESLFDDTLGMSLERIGNGSGCD